MSIIRANFWQRNNGTPVQSVINVYHSRYPSTVVSFANNSWNDLDTITVTPVTTNSRFILIPSYHTSGKGGIRITRNGADLTAGNPQDSNGPYQIWQPASTGQVDWNNSSERQFSTFMYVDSPATTGTIVYRTQIRSYLGTNAADRIGINEVGATALSGATALHSGFTIMEIAI
jgi:hypothetical protein